METFQATNYSAVVNISNTIQFFLATVNFTPSKNNFGPALSRYLQITNLCSSQYMYTGT